MGLARALSKFGFCSRSEAWKLIEAGRVRVNGAICRQPEQRVRPHPGPDVIAVDSEVIQPRKKIYLMLNKPRGLVTTLSDEQGRGTVFECLRDHDLPFLSPVGRLDKASEGLLLFTNDTAWANFLTEPANHVEKTYHVQVDRAADGVLCEKLTARIVVDGELLAIKHAQVLRQGERNAWLEIVLDEGRNRHIRRLLAAFEIEVLRLIRVSIGSLQLGNLAKGAFRQLNEQEIRSLGPSGTPSR